MKIIHISLTSPFTKEMTYQENLLAKYHSKNDHQVYVIASKYYYDNNGNVKKTNLMEEHYNGLNIYRLPILFGLKIKNKLKVFLGLYKLINYINPDIIFVHGIQFFNILSNST